MSFLYQRGALLSALFLLCAGFQPSYVHGVDTTTEAEKRYLIQVVKELKSIEQLVQKAQAQSDAAARMPLYYNGLNVDLREIRRALTQHLEEPSRTPRIIKPLKTSAKR